MANGPANSACCFGWLRSVGGNNAQTLRPVKFCMLDWLIIPEVVSPKYVLWWNNQSGFPTPDRPFSKFLLWTSKLRGMLNISGWWALSSRVLWPMTIPSKSVLSQTCAFIASCLSLWACMYCCLISSFLFFLSSSAFSFSAFSFSFASFLAAFCSKRMKRTDPRGFSVQSHAPFTQDANFRAFHCFLLTCHVNTHSQQQDLCEVLCTLCELSVKLTQIALKQSIWMIDPRTGHTLAFWTFCSSTTSKWCEKLEVNHQWGLSHTAKCAIIHTQLLRLSSLPGASPTPLTDWHVTPVPPPKCHTRSSVSPPNNSRAAWLLQPKSCWTSREHFTLRIYKGKIFLFVLLLVPFLRHPLRCLCYHLQFHLHHHQRHQRGKGSLGWRSHPPPPSLQAFQQCKLTLAMSTQISSQMKHKDTRQRGSLGSPAECNQCSSLFPVGWAVFKSHSATIFCIWNDWDKETDWSNIPRLKQKKKLLQDCFFFVAKTENLQQLILAPQFQHLQFNSKTDLKRHHCWVWRKTSQSLS